ncbi:MAG: hypothetical protein ACXABO_16150 [Promethearchaeota archaeon]|jgi:predicted transcriptional regulator
MLYELTEPEKIVLNVVREYLSKNRYFNMGEILPFLVSRFRIASVNINSKGIEEILRTLVRKKIIIEGSKLIAGDILDNLKRREIYNFICNNPGPYFYKIVKELDMSNHVVVWHLNILLKFNYIQMEKIENHEIYFDSKFNLKNSKLKYITSKEKSKLIIDYFRKNDFGITKTQLSKDLRMHPNTVTKYLKSFEQLNIVKKKKVSKRIIYFLNERYMENYLV